MLCTRPERRVQVEARDRPPGALPVAVRAGDEDDRATVLLDQAGSDDADHAFVPVLAREHVAALRAPRMRPALDLVDRVAQDPVLDRLAVAIQLLEPLREPACLVAVVGEQELERGLRPAETPGGVDTRGEAEGDRTLVDGGRVDVRRAHEGSDARPLGKCELPQPRDREHPVLVHERDDVGDGRQRDQVEVAVEAGRAEGLRELVDDARPAQLRERVVGGACGHDRAPGQRLGRPVVVGDDHLQAEALCFHDLLRGRDAAIDREHQAVALVGDAPQGGAARARSPPRSDWAGASRRRRRDRGGRGRRGRWRRFRRRHSRRGRRSACRPRSRPGSQRRRRRRRRAAGGRGSASSRRGTPARPGRLRSRAGSARAPSSRSRASNSARRRASLGEPDATVHCTASHATATAGRRTRKGGTASRFWAGHDVRTGKPRFVSPPRATVSETNTARYDVQHGETHGSPVSPLLPEPL